LSFSVSFVVFDDDTLSRRNANDPRRRFGPGKESCRSRRDVQGFFREQEQGQGRLRCSRLSEGRSFGSSAGVAEEEVKKFKNEISRESFVAFDFDCFLPLTQTDTLALFFLWGGRGEKVNKKERERKRIRLF